MCFICSFSLLNTIGVVDLGTSRFEFSLGYGIKLVNGFKIATLILNGNSVLDVGLKRTSLQTNIGTRFRTQRQTVRQLSLLVGLSLLARGSRFSILKYDSVRRHTVPTRFLLHSCCYENIQYVTVTTNVK